MALSDSRWNSINASDFPWEREALEFVRARLPERTPYRAWSNFEFIALDGSVNDVDLLVLGLEALFLVEIKSRPGVLRGDAGTWTWTSDGQTRTEDNPLLLANRKARRLASLLQGQRDFRDLRRPYVQGLVFCSSPALRLDLDERGRQHVYPRDVAPAEGRPARPGIVARLTETPPPGSARHRIDAKLERAVCRALEQAGIRPTQRARTVGDFRLERLIGDGPGYQDWEATHVALADTGRGRAAAQELLPWLEQGTTLDANYGRGLGDYYRLHERRGARTPLTRNALQGGSRPPPRAAHRRPRWQGGSTRFFLPLLLLPLLLLTGPLLAVPTPVPGFIQCPSAPPNARFTATTPSRSSGLCLYRDVPAHVRLPVAS